MNLEDYFKRLQRIAEQEKNQKHQDPPTKPNKDELMG